MSLPEKYRPARFDDVVGQPEAVRFLSGLILAGTRGRNIFFYGAIGSGKTSLAKIFAKGLNCESPDATGSPCDVCASCKNPSAYFFEYDVPGQGGDVEAIKNWLDDRYQTPIGRQVRVLFFDEVHEMTPKAQASLLKRTETPKDRVIFCVATSERQAITPAFSSRFRPVAIHSLTTEEAVSLLEKIAGKEGILYDREALYLLAAVKPRQPRDLISGLEQLNAIESPVSAELVERVFGLDFRYLVYRYCVALADGDEAAQRDTMRLWRDSTSAKIAWTQCFLTETFYNNVLGQSEIIDPLMHTLEVERLDVVRRFCRRLKVSGARELVPYFEAMLQFWSGNLQDDEGNLELKLGLFEALVNRHLMGKRRPAEDAPFVSSDEVVRSVFEIGVAAAVAERSVQRGDSNYLEAEDAVDLVNRVSFFAQHHGKLINTAITIIPSPDALKAEPKAIEAILAFTSALSETFDVPDGNFASVTLFERQSSIVGRVVAHVPEVSGFRSDLRNWSENWEARTGDTISVVHDRNRSPVKFHWNEVTALCSGAEEANTDTQGEVDLRFRLGIARKDWKQLAPMSCALILYSGRLNRASIEAACANGMNPKSAFSLTSRRRLNWDGWELDEHRIRTAEVHKRRAVIAETTARFADDPARLREELRRLENIWSSVAAGEGQRGSS